MKKTLLAALLIVLVSAPVWAADWGFSISIGGPFGHSRHISHQRVILPRAHHRVVVTRPAGHYVWRERQEWVPGYYEIVHVAAETRQVWVPDRVTADHEFVPGHWETHIRPAYDQKVWHEGYYKTVREQVWVSY